MNFWINIWHKVSPCPNTHHSIPCFPSLSVFLHIISLCKTLYTATPINLNVPIWILMTSIFMVTVMLLLKSNCSIPQGKNAATSIWKHHIWNKLVKFWTVQYKSVFTAAWAEFLPHSYYPCALQKPWNHLDSNGLPFLFYHLFLLSFFCNNNT